MMNCPPFDCGAEDVPFDDSVLTESERIERENCNVRESETGSSFESAQAAVGTDTGDASGIHEASGIVIPSLLEYAWPAPLEREAFHGLAGQFVETILPASEADAAALLMQFLVAAGNALGRTVFARAESDRHYTNEFAVLVGKSSKGRKGTSLGRVRETFRRVDVEWEETRVLNGLSSGEGLIWSVRDPIERQENKSPKGQPPQFDKVIADIGVSDKRALIIEPEFAAVLKQTERQGNTLSPVIRQAWDTGNLRCLTKSSPAQATGAHISLIGHITADELRRYLTATEIANGFGNRFMWILVGRSKYLPEGGTPDVKLLAEVERGLAAVMAFARSGHEIARDAEARELWRDVYPHLARDGYGLAGSLTGRAEAHVLRLSLIYAVLDRSPVVRIEHLEAALAVWKYAEDSVHVLFGDATGNPVADEILQHLRTSRSGLSRTAIRDIVGKNTPAPRIEDALRHLHRLGLAHFERHDTPGRPAEVWFARRRGRAHG